MAIKIRTLKRLIRHLPDDALVMGYEGESIGLIILNKPNPTTTLTAIISAGPIKDGKEDKQDQGELLTLRKMATLKSKGGKS